MPDLDARDQAQVPLQEQDTILTADPTHWHQEHRIPLDKEEAP